MEVIPCRAHAFRNVSARTTLFPGQSPVLGDCGAAGFGHLGVVFCSDGESSVFSAHAPDWVISSQCGIYDFELAESLGGAEETKRELPTRVLRVVGG